MGSIPAPKIVQLLSAGGLPWVAVPYPTGQWTLTFDCVRRMTGRMLRKCAALPFCTSSRLRPDKSNRECPLALSFSCTSQAGERAESWEVSEWVVASKSHNGRISISGQEAGTDSAESVEHGTVRSAPHPSCRDWGGQQDFLSLLSVRY